MCVLFILTFRVSLCWFPSQCRNTRTPFPWGATVHTHTRQTKCPVPGVCVSCWVGLHKAVVSLHTNLLSHCLSLSHTHTHTHTHTHKHADIIYWLFIASWGTSGQGPSLYEFLRAHLWMCVCVCVCVCCMVACLCTCMHTGMCLCGLHKETQKENKKQINAVEERD